MSVIYGSLSFSFIEKWTRFCFWNSIVSCTGHSWMFHILSNFGWILCFWFVGTHSSSSFVFFSFLLNVLAMLAGLKLSAITYSAKLDWASLIKLVHNLLIFFKYLVLNVYRLWLKPYLLWVISLVIMLFSWLIGSFPVISGSLMIFGKASLLNTGSGWFSSALSMLFKFLDIWACEWSSKQ